MDSCYMYRMQKKDEDVLDYTEVMDELFDGYDLNEESRVSFYVRGLKQSIGTIIFNRDTPPETFTEAQKIAKDIELNQNCSLQNDNTEAKESMSDMKEQIKLMAASMAAFQKETQNSLMAMSLGPATVSHTGHQAPAQIQQVDLLGSLPLASQNLTLSPMQTSQYGEYLPQNQSMAPMQVYTHPNAQTVTPTQTIQPRQGNQSNQTPQTPAQNVSTQGYNNFNRNRNRSRGRGRGQNYQGNDNYNPSIDSGDFQRMSANYHNAHPQNQTFYQTPYNYQPNYQHPPPTHFFNQGYQNQNQAQTNQPQGYQTQSNHTQGYQTQPSNRQSTSGHNWPQRSTSPGGGSYVREPYQQQNQNQQPHRPPTPHSSPSNNRGGNY
jgi:hypothetical protein